MSAPTYPSHPNTQSDAMTERSRDEAAKLAETAQQDLLDIGEEVKQQAAALGEEAKTQMGEISEKAKGMASEQKDLLADQLGSVSDVLQKVAGELEERDETSSRYVRMVADGANRLTSTIRDHDVDDILAMAQEFGRRQPAAFLGAAALLGFAASRFVMASANRRTGMSVGTQRIEDAARSYSAPASSDKSTDYAQSVGGNDAGI